MGSLSQARTYGGVGSILILLAPVPSIGWLLAISGLVLTLVAVKYISDAVKDATIMNDMLISIVTAVAGIFIGFFVLLASFLRFVGLNNLNPSYFANFNPATVPEGDWLALALSVGVGLVLIWALMTVSAVFLRRGYSKIGYDLNVSLFGTAGLVFLIGAATTVLLVGFVLIPVAILLLALAFFSISETRPGLLPPGATPS